jgi:beta-glucosidase
LILDASRSEWPTKKTAKLKLEKGHRYALKLDESWDKGLFQRLTWRREIPQPLARAVDAARNADVIVAVVGLTSDLEGEEMEVRAPGFRGGDRTSLDLPGQEEDLLQKVQGTGKPLIVVLMNGGALAVNWAAEHANAILEAWYSGEEGGTAVAETLAGANNPAGRLPVTFYKAVSQLPPFTDYSMKNRTYRYFSGQPLFPFGFGLSYSKFEYANVKLSSSQLAAGDPLTVEADVKNSSGRAGDEVAEVYLNFPAVAGAPLRALRGFQRVPVAAGATQHVRIQLTPRDLSLVNETGDRVIAEGAYRLSIGGGQPGVGSPGAAAEFTVTGESKLPE